MIRTSTSRLNINLRFKLGIRCWANFKLVRVAVLIVLLVPAVGCNREESLTGGYILYQFGSDEMLITDREHVQVVPPNIIAYDLVGLDIVGCRVESKHTGKSKSFRSYFILFSKTGIVKNFSNWPDLMNSYPKIAKAATNTSATIVRTNK